MAMGILQKALIVERSGTGAKVARLTPKGQEVKHTCDHLLGIVEERWQNRFGSDVIGALRESLERLAEGPLFQGLEPYPDGWRASVRKPTTLPHYPMVLHRGGFPDGS